MKHALLLLTGLTAVSVSAQNDCGTALPVTGGLYHVAAFTGVPPTLFCAPNGQNPSHAQWYSYTPAADHFVTVTTDLPQNTGQDTRVHIYSGPCNAPVCAGGDDDSGTGNLTVASFDAIGGTTYTIVFDNQYSSTAFDWQLNEANPVGPGNRCDVAIPVTVGTYTVDSIDGVAPSLFCAPTEATAGHGEWYTYTPTENHSLTITTDLPQNLGGDTRFHVYTGTCNDPTCKAGDDDSGTGNLSTATFNVLAGVTYIIVFDDHWSDAGFDFQLIEGDPIPVAISFTASTVLTGWPMGAVDMNNDHLDDVVIPGPGAVQIGYQQPDGTLQMLSRPASSSHDASWSFCAGDINKDGYNDMMYGSGSGASFLMANGDATAYAEVSFPQYIFCQRTNMVDLNNDGNLDAFSCHDVDANVYFTNDGTGNLTFHQGGMGPTCGNYGSIFIDYDNDGDQDMFIAKCGCDPVDLFMRNDGNFTFTNIAAANNFADSHQSWSSAWGDFDNDGDMDVLVGASSSGYHKLMRNDGTTFTNVTAGSGVDSFGGNQSIEWVTHDFNNDGYLDILGGYGFMLGHGDMTFTAVEGIPTNGPIGDLNNDGFLDIVSGGHVNLNDGNNNHWITIATVGTTSNSDGIGARVQITSALGTQIRDVRSGDGFEDMSSLNTHFGLGADTVITNLTIRWPSGLVTTLEDVPVDTAIVVVEGVSTSVHEVSDNGLHLFPSPVENTLYVRGTQELGNSPVRVMDAAGKLALRSALRNGTLDVSGLAPGLYFLAVDGGVLNGKFLKQ